MLRAFEKLQVPVLRYDMARKARVLKECGSLTTKLRTPLRSLAVEFRGQIASICSIDRLERT